MTSQESNSITLVVNIVYKGEVVASKCRLSNDELFGLREGAYNLEEQLKGIANAAVKQAYKHEAVLQTIKAKNNA